jgi:hypothetical protein
MDYGVENMVSDGTLFAASKVCILNLAGVWLGQGMEDDT